MGSFSHPIHKHIIMFRVVVEYSKPLSPCFFAKAHAFVPRGMPPADLGGEFLFRISGVVYDQVGTLNQPKYILVQLTRHVLGVSD